MSKLHGIGPTALPLAALFFVGMANRLPAQEDPFGGAGPKPAAAAPAAGAKAAAPPDVTKRDPLVIEMLRASNPTTPEQLLSAAQSALQFGRPDECKRYLAKLVAAKPGDDALAPLTARYGDFLLQLSRNSDVQPEGKQVADLVQNAARLAAENPEKIAAAIAQLSDKRPGMRQVALGQLALAGTRVVNPMLHALADPGRAGEYSNIRTALVQLAAATELPLIGALDTPNGALKVQVVAVLGRMQSSLAAVRLVRPALDPQSPTELRQLAAAALQRISGAVPDLYEAEKFLTREINRLLAGDLPIPKDLDDRVQLWSWDAAKQGVVPIAMPRPDAGLLLAARVAGDLYALRPSDPAARRRMLLLNLEYAKTVSGLDQPLSLAPGSAGAAALAAGPQVVNSVLADALGRGRIAAAIAAAEALGHCGEPSVLHEQSGASPLAEAMRSADRRVRLTAALAAVKLDPGGSFPGASRVSETLGWFVGTTGSTIVLIGHPRGEEAQTLVGYMNALGYEGEGAYLGRVVVDRALNNPDHEFILLADSIDMPPVEELIQWLRRDFRTARLPIGVMARSERFEALREKFVNDAFTTVFPRIHSLEVATNEVNKLNAIAGRNLVPRDERLLQARAALAALSTLAKNASNFAPYELLRHEPTLIRALNNPALTADAAALLAVFATPKAQTALVDFAGQNSHSLADRQAAAAAFAAAVRVRGLLLTQSQIAQQYQRYNASATMDASTQQLLGSILDAVEAPAIARGDLSRRD
jgi:hypothetical protein